jgi:hypothetical protein
LRLALHRLLKYWDRKVCRDQRWWTFTASKYTSTGQFHHTTRRQTLTEVLIETMIMTMLVTFGEFLKWFDSRWSGVISYILLRIAAAVFQFVRAASHQKVIPSFSEYWEADCCDNPQKHSTSQESTNNIYQSNSRGVWLTPHSMKCCIIVWWESTCASLTRWDLEFAFHGIISHQCAAFEKFNRSN